MSLTAIFKRSPQRYAEVGPSVESNQPITYRNPGISLAIFDANREAAAFTQLIAAAKMAALRDRWVVSYATATSEVASVTLIESYADARAKKSSEEPRLPVLSELTPEFDIVSARAFVNVTKKVQQVSIEV